MSRYMKALGLTGVYGTAWKKDATEKLVSLAIQSGFRGIDTVCQPKHCRDAGVGAGVAARIKKDGLTRADLYLQTKFTSLSGQDPATSSTFSQSPSLTTSPTPRAFAHDGLDVLHLRQPEHYDTFL